MPTKRNKPSAMMVFMNDVKEHMEAKYKKKFKAPFDKELYDLCKPMYNELDETLKDHYKELARTQWKEIRVENLLKMKEFSIRKQSEDDMQRIESDRIVE
uniref:Uncharacterized protein n=1 Tax=Cacopsylla melanoneura TaxID=428564 RepID=A0A8D9B889_9HEMI